LIYLLGNIFALCRDLSSLGNWHSINYQLPIYGETLGMIANKETKVKGSGWKLHFLGHISIKIQHPSEIQY